MALETPVDAEAYEALPEAIQEHYTEAQDGKYHLGIEGKTPSEERLEATLKRWKDAAGSSDPTRIKRRIEEAEAIREGFGELDPEQARAAIERLEQLESGEGDKDREAEIKRIREGLESKHEKVIGEKDQQIQRLTSHVEQREIDQELDRGLAKAGVIEQTRPAVKALLRSRGPKVVWEDGKPRGVFSGELGDEIPVVTYVEAWAKTDEAKPFLPASGNNGSGAQNNRGGGGGGGANPWKKGEGYNLTEQGRIVKENPALAKQLKAAAGA